MLVLINKIAMLSDLGTVSTGTSAPLVALRGAPIQGF
jgi:hypothetical protein